MGTKKTKEQNLVFKYAGNLTGADGVFLHYGLSDEWKNVTESKMRKLKNCYKAEITIPGGEKIKFCFRDTNGNWDNNFGRDYCFEMGKETEYPNLQIEMDVPETTKKTVRNKV
jgi:hypothetical protein